MNEWIRTDNQCFVGWLLVFGFVRSCFRKRFGRLSAVKCFPVAFHTWIGARAVSYWLVVFSLIQPSKVLLSFLQSTFCLSCFFSLSPADEEVASLNMIKSAPVGPVAGGIMGCIMVLVLAVYAYRHQIHRRSHQHMSPLAAQGKRPDTFI